MFPLYLFRALTASRVLYNRPEHSQGFYHNAVKNGTEGKRLQFSLKKIYIQAKRFHSYLCFQIENWKFCSNNSHEDCNTGDEGEFVDVTLVIKSKGKPKPHEEDEISKRTKHRRPRCFKRGKYNKCPKEFDDIGGGSEMMLSSQVG